MVLPKEQLWAEWASVKRKSRAQYATALAITALIFLFCMCWKYNAFYYDEKFIPLTYASNLWLALRYGVASLLHLPMKDSLAAQIAALDSVLYLGALARLKITAMSLLAGAGLAVSGALFQTAYRNPMASPNILGATAGVKLGNVIVIMLYSVQAFDHIFLRYRYCYGFTALCVGAVLVLGKLAGRKSQEVSVIEMVMAGSIVSQFLNVVTMYLMYNLTEEDLILYQQISMGTYLDTGVESTILFFLVMLIALIPVLLLRYRLNVLAMNHGEALSAGVSVTALRLIAQLCGVLMVTCAMIHFGEAGMMAMVVPYVVRRVVGADFRRVCIYSALTGGCLMMLCRLLTSFLQIAGEEIPITFFINLILMPVFMVILARRKGGRNEA